MNKKIKLSDAIKCAWQRQFENSGAIVIGTTNNHDMIDEAVKDRFGEVLHVRLPSNDARRMMFQHALREHTHNLQDSDWELLVGRTNGFSGRQVNRICADAATSAARDTAMECEARNVSSEGMSPRPITIDDFVHALRTISNSATGQAAEQARFIANCSHSSHSQ